MEPIEGSETSAFRTQMPGNYPNGNALHKEHGESLISNITLPLPLILVKSSGALWYSRRPAFVKSFSFRLNGVIGKLKREIDLILALKRV